MTVALPGIRRLVEHYDLFILDLWGTIHDGLAPYPGAVDALKRLAKAGKPVALLSNAPRRAASVAQSLAAMGVARELYAVLLTSGEATHVALRDRDDPWHARLRGPCWHLGPMRDRALFEGLDLSFTESPQGAGFCVATGAAMAEETVEDYRPDLDRALELGLPMICANPDVLVPQGTALVLCAGAFAQYYARRRGSVFWHGKPHAAIYRGLFAQIEALGGNPIDRSRIIAIGDGIATDVAGAKDAGIDAALLAGGLHRRELRVGWRGRPARRALSALIDRAPAAPDYILPRLVW